MEPGNETRVSHTAGAVFDTVHSVLHMVIPD